VNRNEKIRGLKQYFTGDRCEVQACLLCLALAFFPTLAIGADLDWSVTPYIWASDTKFDLKAGDVPIGGELTFDDLLDTTDNSFQVVTEAGIAGGNWSAFIDFTYLETSDNYKGQLLFADSDSEQLYLDAVVAWWPQGRQKGFNIYGGARYTDLDDRTKFFLTEDKLPLTTLRNDRDFLDALNGGMADVQACRPLVAARPGRLLQRRL